MQAESKGDENSDGRSSISFAAAAIQLGQSYKFSWSKARRLA